MTIDTAADLAPSAERMRGRPHNLNPQVLQIIADTLRTTNTVTTACERADIAPRTFHQWVEKGVAHLAEWITANGADPAEVDLPDWLHDHPFDQAPYVHFAHAVKRARAEFKTENLAAISLEAVGTTVEETRTEVREKVLIDAEGEQVVERLTTTTTTRRPRKSWQAAAWLLERTLPTEFGRSYRPEEVPDDPDSLPVPVEDGPAQRLLVHLGEIQARSLTPEQADEPDDVTDAELVEDPEP